MPSFSQIDIVESPQLLAELIEQETNLKRFRKLRMLYLLKTEKVKTLSHIAQIFGLVSRTVQNWGKLYRQGGLTKLLHDRQERFVDIPEWVLDRLIEKFKEAQFLPPLKEIQTWLQQELEVEIDYKRLHGLLSHTVIPIQQAKRVQPVQSSQRLDLKDLAWLEAQPELHEKFAEWQAERGFLNQVQALNQLLGEFFDLRPVHGISPFQVPGMSLIEALAQGALASKIPYHIPDLLSEQRLSERLRVHNSTLKNERWRRTFPGWTKQRDPDGVGWLWVPELRKYRPLLDQKEIQAVLLSPVKSRQ